VSAPQTNPGVNYRTPQQEIPNSTMTTTQLQRAWCLMLTRAIWPTVDAHTAVNLARWIYGERTDAPS
jgi:hypothetical protein